MNFVNDFFWHSAFAALVASIWFSLPGLWVLRLLGLQTHWRILSAGLVAPALGLCTYGPFSLAFTAVFGYSTGTLIIAWLFFQAVIWFWLRQTTYFSTSTEDFCRLSSQQSLLLLLGAALWAIIPTINIFPAVYQGGLFINWPIADHSKIAINSSVEQ